MGLHINILRDHFRDSLFSCILQIAPKSHTTSTDLFQIGRLLMLD